MTRRNALSCRSARRNYRPASTCLRLFLNHPKQPASYPLASSFERETSHNQVLTRTRAVCLQAASNLRFILPATTKQPPAGTAAATRTHTCKQSRQPQAFSGTAGTIFDLQAHSQASQARFFNSQPQYFDLQALAGSHRQTHRHSQAHPLTGKQPANDHFQPDRHCIWHSRTHLRMSPLF